jgi:hypothetical protein
MKKWDYHYTQYLTEMTVALEPENELSPEIKDAKSKDCQIVIHKYKEVSVLFIVFSSESVSKLTNAYDLLNQMNIVAFSVAILKTTKAKLS